MEIKPIDNDKITNAETAYSKFEVLNGIDFNMYEKKLFNGIKRIATITVK